MQIDWMLLSIWMGSILGSFIMGFVVGEARGAKNFEMILKHLRKIQNKRSNVDVDLEELRATINSIFD